MRMTLVRTGHIFTSLEFVTVPPTTVDMIAGSVHSVIRALTVIRSTFVKEDQPLS